jgi:hypothetical protein
VNQFGYPESDWKLYKSKVGDWQEGYMEKLCKEYIALLSSDKLPSDRFWELEKRIREDKRATGVVVTNSRCTGVFFIDQQSAVKVQAYVFHHIFQNVHRLTSL